ncbi:MAG: hypothetical protein KDD94_13890, partial [Calditrichaeota bacterium]|nr:hypothetical protein [Calditrichota bacterium]
KNDIYPDVYFDPYDYRNIYWLGYSVSDINVGKRLFKKNGSALEQNQLKIFAPEYFNQSVHLEQNKYLAQRAIPNVESSIRNRGLYHQRDYWFWEGPIEEGIFTSFDIDILDDIYKEISDNIYFSVMMSGAASNYSGNHRVEFKVSSATYQTPVTLDWTGSHYQRIDFQIPVGLLKEKNTFEVKTLTQSDQTLLNSIDIQFKSKFLARNNIINFNAVVPDEFRDSSVFKYKIDGFTSDKINVLKKNEAIIVNTSIVKSDNNTFSVVFQDQIENQNAEFYAYTDDMMNTPIAIKLNEVYSADENLKSHRSNSEMIIITTKLFEPYAIDYANYKKNKHNISAEVVLAEVIYNEFNFGNESPTAIRDFLKYAYENWSDDNRLRYVILIGDAKREYYFGNTLNNVVPTFQYISYNKGFTASDSFYGYLYHSKDDYIDFNNNPINDLYVGRIPSETVNELQAYFNKVKEYDEAPPEIQNLFLSGNDYSNTPSNREFNSSDRVFLSQLSRINSSVVDESNNLIMRRAADDPGNNKWVLQESTQLINLFNQGFNYMSFMGHGAGAVWGDRNIMVQDDALKLNNKGHYPIILSMTCYVGAFDGPGKTLGEIMLLEPNLGAVGVLSSSGVSVIYNQFMLGYYLNEETYRNRISYG